MENKLKQLGEPPKMDSCEACERYGLVICVYCYAEKKNHFLCSNCVQKTLQIDLKDMHQVCLKIFARRKHCELEEELLKHSLESWNRWKEELK